jgi:hypothetical protein
MLLKFWLYRRLTEFFAFLASVGEKGQQRFDYCERCNLPKWTAPPCVNTEAA